MRLVSIIKKSSLRKPHTFSMGLRSGLSRGIFQQKMSLDSKKLQASWLLCLGLLSCISLCLCGYTCFTKGIKTVSKIFISLVANTFTMNITILVAP